MKLLKSEKLALLKIRELTIELNKIGCVITNDDFIQKGLSRREFVIKATNSLVEKGLISKVKFNEHEWRYQLTKKGIKLLIPPVHVFNDTLQNWANNKTIEKKS